jgi:hypothetical protein
MKDEDHRKENQIRVQSWSELQQELFARTWNDNLGRFRSNYVYRGLSGTSHTLQSRLIRLGGDFSKLEKHLIRNFKKYAHSRATFGDSNWIWIALAQHHGLPTRLLDWTYSPYIALHFVTDTLEKYSEDGVIWCVNYVKSNEYIPKKLKKELEKEGSNVFTAEMLQHVCKNLPEFDDLDSNAFLIFFEPPSIDERIINQYALFSLLSDPTVVLCEWLRDHHHLYRKIIIPAELKWEIRDKLDQANITERVLFPGLDGLSSWLTRHYSPRF